MKNIVTYISVLVVMFLSSCENDPIMWDKSKTFVAFTASSINVPEASATPKNINLMIAGLETGNSITVNYEISTAGIANPAILGTDYTLSTDGSVAFPEGAGTAIIAVTPIDNHVFTGDKSFYISVTTNSGSFENGRASKILVVIKDDEHPLAKWIGTYTVTAASYGLPGDWDEEWTVTTVPNPDDVNKLLMTGFVGRTGIIEGVLDVDAMTIKIVAGQALGLYGTYGNLGVYLGSEDGQSIVDGNLMGTISEDGTIAVDRFGVLFDSGSEEGNLYDVFNTTWEK